MRKDKAIIILGTAHLSSTPGKCSPDGRLKECVYSREIIGEVKAKLESYGYKVIVDYEQLEPKPEWTAARKKAGYGDDILWVGNTFGLGAFRGWNGKEPTMIEPVRSRTQRVIAYGPLRTIVELFDRGWKAESGKPALNMTIRYTQYAGHRDTDVDVFFNRDVTDYLFSTGIINVMNSKEFSDHKGLRGCWGTDWPSSDTINFKRETVGLGICIPMKYIKEEIAADKEIKQGGNYTFIVGTDQKHLQYKVVYSSDNEDFGYHSAQEWFQFLKEWKKELEKPIEIKY